jgi:PAS domain S-box-containing protein
MAIPFERLVGETTEGITVCDFRRPDMPLIWVNRGFLNLTGYRKNEVLGRNCRFLQGPDTDPAAVERVRQALRECEAVVVELLNQRKNGTQFYNSLSLSPVLGADGEPDYYIGVQTDVTERRLRRQREHEFVDNVAHELKTPLTALAGLIDTLGRPLEPAVRDDLLQRASGQAQRLISMVEELLSLSAAEAALTAPPVPLDLRELALAALELLAPAARSHDIELRSDLPDTPQVLYGRPQALATAISNLLDNAVKYTPPGGRVELSLHRGGSELVLRVADTGCGIPPEHQARVFERFYRVAGDRARSTGGAGLGLALVAEAVAQAGGSVALDSTPGRGSVFTVRLPLDGGLPVG